MLQYIHIAVDLLALDKLREALSAYRNHIQHFSPGSFQVIVETLLTRANANVVRPESSNWPDSALVASVTAGEDVHAQKHLSFLWDVYGVLLDLIKTNGKLIPLYVYTVFSALAFCSRNNLKSECMKLGQALHNHLQGVFKMTEQRSEGSQTLSYAIDLGEAETALALIQVRIGAMETMMNMNLMVAAIQQAEDVASFRLYIRSIPIAEEVKLWSLLSSWFFSTSNLALHAYLQQHLYWVTLKYSKTATPEKLTDMKNLAVISALAASNYEPRGEEMNKFMGLLRLGIVPRRHLLLGQCKSRGMLDSVDQSVRNLYEIMEEQYAPLTLIDSIRSAASSLPSQYHHYLPFLHSVSEEIVIKQLSSIYQSITVVSFIGILKLDCQAKAEKRILAAIKSGSIVAKIDQKKGLIEFPQGEGLQGLCWKLSQMSDLLGQFQAIVNPNRPPAVSMKEVLLSTKESRSAIEKMEMAEKFRKERIFEQQQEEEHARKRDLETKSKSEESTAMMKKKLDIEQQKQKLNVQRRHLYLEEIEFWVEKMRKEGFDNKEMKIRGKKVKDMTDDDKLEIGFEDFIALHKKLFDSAKQAREDQMQQASRQLQYKERAKREVEAAVLQSQWEAEQDTEIQNVIQQHKVNYEQDLALKHLFAPAVSHKLAFIQSETEKARVPYDQQYDSWLKTQVDSLSHSILDVAKEMRSEERKKQAELKRLDTVVNLEQEAKIKQDEAKRKLYEESGIKAKENLDGWQTVRTPSGTGKRFVNSKKVEEVKTPTVVSLKEEVKRPEPPSPATPSLSSRWTRPETVVEKPVEARPAELKPAPNAGYQSRFSNVNKKKEAEAKK